MLSKKKNMNLNGISKILYLRKVEFQYHQY